LIEVANDNRRLQCINEVGSLFGAINATKVLKIPERVQDSA